MDDDAYIANYVTSGLSGLLPVLSKYVQRYANSDKFFSLTTVRVHITPYKRSQCPNSGIVGRIIANKVIVVTYSDNNHFVGYCLANYSTPKDRRRMFNCFLSLFEHALA